MYVAERSGLNMREKPDAASKRILSVPYGTKIQASDTGKPGEIEGLWDRWYKTTYNGKEGYLLGVYLAGMPLPRASCGSFIGYFRQITGAKDDGRMREILQKEFSISYSEGGKTCASGYTASFEKQGLKDVFLLSRLLYEKEFPALKQKFFSIAKKEKDGSARIDLSRRGSRSVTEISIVSQGDGVSFEEITTDDPCEP